MSFAIPAQAAPAAAGVRRLTGGEERSVLDFLSERPAHTAFMAGLIHSNGLESPLNRGDFYGYTNREGALEGVARIGHAVIFEAKSAAALDALARLAGRHSPSALVRGERDKIGLFWEHYARAGRRALSVCEEHLLELCAESAAEPRGGRDDRGDCSLRPATPSELEQVMAANAAMARAESGVDPWRADPEGFRARTLRRIQLGRVWVWACGGERVIFKAEILAQTPQAIYLEGVHVHPDERGKGVGLRALERLHGLLLRHAPLLCLFVNDGNRAAQSLYRKAGYLPAGRYRTFYLDRETGNATTKPPVSGAGIYGTPKIQ